MRSSEVLTIWTIGHSSRSWSEFLDLLRDSGIAAVADVRRFPGSRNNPQFGGETLQSALREAQIAYLPFPELGGRRKPSPDSPHTVWRHPAFRAYADFMETPEYQAGREKLLELAAKKRTAILCAEAVWWRCHRSMIADDLKTSGITVLHILGPRQIKEHPYTSAAKVEAGRLVYGSE